MLPKRHATQALPDSSVTPNYSPATHTSGPLIGGFNAEHYAPNPTGLGSPERQHLYIGVALNLQEVLNRLFFRHERARDTRAQEFARGFFVDWAAEHIQVPFTAAPVIQMQRTNR